MKGFDRTEPRFSQCGLNCLLCSMHLGGYCPGCGGGRGNQSCAVARCAMERKTGGFCSGCGQFPCERIEKMAEYDSFVPHSRMVRDLKRAESMGIEAYIAQLEEKRAILNQLLVGWNDGRRKSFYCLAAYLLELEDLRGVFLELQAAVPADRPIKEKAITAVGILKKTAEVRGVILKLNKKPKEK